VGPKITIRLEDDVYRLFQGEEPLMETLDGKRGAVKFETEQAAEGYLLARYLLAIVENPLRLSTVARKPPLGEIRDPSARSET
jgi:hypothetical protein